MGWGSLCGLQATEKAHHMAGGLTKMSCCPTQARCHPTGSIGGPFENQSEALGLLSRIEPLEVGVQWRTLENLLDGSNRFPKHRSLPLASSDHVAHAGLYPRSQQVSLTL